MSEVQRKPLPGGLRPAPAGTVWVLYPAKVINRARSVVADLIMCSDDVMVVRPGKVIDLARRERAVKEVTQVLATVVRGGLTPCAWGMVVTALRGAYAACDNPDKLDEWRRVLTALRPILRDDLTVLEAIRRSDLEDICG